MPKKYIKQVSILILLVLLTGVSGFSAQARPVQGIKPGKADDFTLKNLQGKDVSLSANLKKGPVLLVFWTTWCPYCVQEIPEVIALQNKYASKGLKILGVNIQESMGKVSSVADSKGVNYEVVLDADGTVAQSYGVRGIPASALIDTEGNIVFQGVGLPSEQKIQGILS